MSCFHACTMPRQLGHLSLVGFFIMCLFSGSIIVPSTAFRPFGNLREALSAATETKGFDGEVWALLIAGSATWGNYRHQADVAHAYQVLKRGGLKDDHIVVMHADDIAGNIQNPHVGKVFNSYNGPDVYHGLPKDYVGDAVSALNFLTVLRGGEDSAVILGTSGKVIKSGPKDRVFVYFADHGAPGILGMPSGEFLYADQLIDTLRNKSAANGFGEMVLFIEACESGSIFQGMLDDSLANVWATTAANAMESSWGVYCPGQTPGPPIEFNTCLGDLYSVAWLEDSDDSDLTQETLEQQYARVKLRTSNNGTYDQGSHVQQFGSKKIDEEPVADYLGSLNTGPQKTAVSSNSRVPWTSLQAISQREADLVPLRYAVQHASSAAERFSAQAELDSELSRRLAADRAVREAVAIMLRQPSVALLFKAQFANALDMGDLSSVTANASFVEVLVKQPLPRKAGLPSVDDWECLRAMMRMQSSWLQRCGLEGVREYTMQYSRAFANLCNAGVSISAANEAASLVCPSSVTVA